MTLEQQVCSLELAKRLKELGVKQESFFTWRGWSRGWMIDVDRDRQGRRISSVDDGYSAFTVAELGEMLPEAFSWGGTQVALSAVKYSGGWHVRYMSGQYRKSRSVNEFQDAATEADARAKMLIYLLENKLITL
jgi:hypothetical protein